MHDSFREILTRYCISCGMQSITFSTLGLLCIFIIVRYVSNHANHVLWFFVIVRYISNQPCVVLDTFN